MAHLNLYLPDDWAKRVRNQAKRRGLSLSAYIAELIQQPSPRGRWPKDFFTKIVGSWKGDFPDVPRPPPEKRESL